MVAAIASLYATQSCDSFLDKEPLDRLSAGQFWETKQDFDMALTALYGHLQTPMFAAGTPDWDLITDNGFGQHNSNGSRAIVQGDIFSSSDGYITGVYNTCYAGIARANIFLAQLANYQGTALDDAAKARYEGEARFMRAYYYYFLYACYGDVPLVTEPLTLENQAQPKVAAAQILETIYQDIDFAIQSLPSTSYAAGNGHLVQSSAQALKLRILLFTGYGDNGVANVALLTQARDIARQLMSAGYSLANNFESVFRDNTQQNNPEIIFSVKFLAPDNATSMDQWYGDWLVASPLRSFYNAFEAGDLRRDLTVFVNEVNFNGNIHRPSNNVPTGLGLKKFLTPELMPYGYSTQSQQDWVMFRYADVLLSFAEAENEINGATTEVHNAVNAIRNRAGLDDLPGNLTKEQMRQAIRRERRMEFAFEGQRYFDLKRWHIAEETLNSVTDGVLVYRFEERFYHWPLPQTEIDKSNGVLVQNPDYQ